MLIAAFSPCFSLLSLATDWRSHIDYVTGQTFGFGTGDGIGADMKVEIYHQCRMDTSDRTYVGELYPSSNVQGIDSDQSDVVNSPGEGNSISFSFSEGISDNSDIYLDNGDNTAKVEFCVQVGLYHNSMLINFAEVKLTYWIDLVTNFAALTGYTVTQAETFHDASDESISFDGTLLAYFCNPYDYQELVDDGSIKHQGSVMHVCFKVPDGSFEISDIRDFTVKNAIADDPSQTIITGTAVSSPGYAEKTCYDSDRSDTNLCMVSFVLTADFYEYSAMTLTGSGSVLLEFGDATGSRRRLGESNHGGAPQGGTVGNFTLKAIEMRTEPIVKLQIADAGINVPVTMSVITGMLILFAVSAMRICVRCRQRKKLDQVYLKLRARHVETSEKDHCGESCVTNATMDMTMGKWSGHHHDFSSINEDESYEATGRRRLLNDDAFLDREHKVASCDVDELEESLRGSLLMPEMGRQTSSLSSHRFSTIDEDELNEDDSETYDAIDLEGASCDVDELQDQSRRGSF